MRFDRLLPLEFGEQTRCQASNRKAVAIDEFEGCDFAALVFDEGNIAALRECMEHTLFVSRNVH